MTARTTGTTTKILVVDDSLTVRMDLAEALAGEGYDVVPCATVAEARAALGRERLALVILDVRLPDGDGVEFLREIRGSAAATVPVMLLTSEAEVHDRVIGLRTGADEYIGKPYDVGYVLSRARQLVRAADDTQAEPRTTVLVVDDSLTFREGLREALIAEGYEVAVAANGEEGLRLAGDLRPTAIIVDGVMPDIDGATVIRRVRLDAVLRATPCLLLTASEGEDAELRALDAGADAFVRKEVDIAVILARLAAVLRTAASRAATATSSVLGAKRVLAVDDSETFLQALGAALRGDHYDIVLARSGEEALELLAIQPVDCILLDITMPGLGGRETCARIKATPILRDVPLIMLAEAGDQAALLAGLAAGADDYLAKASDFEVLRARIRAQIRRRQFEDENRRAREQVLRLEREALEADAARELAETRKALVDELERKNRELEAFSYSVSHDLRAPLRSIDGFSRIVLDQYADTLDPKAQDYLGRVRAAAQRMGELIDDLLELSRVGRAALRREKIDLTDLVRRVIVGVERTESDRPTTWDVEPDMVVHADPRLVQVVLENLLGNAFKFTRNVDAPRIQVSMSTDRGTNVYAVRDNGAGFDMTYAGKLFTPFQRLHDEREFAGTGIGLATVHRIVDRHGGRIWAEGKVGVGATISWTMPLRADPLL